MCVLSDHQPANHQEFELSITEETAVNTGKSKEHCAQGIKSEFKDASKQRISPDSNTAMFERQNEHCAQPIISEFEGARTQRISPDSNTVMFERQNEHCAQAIISQFEDARTQKVSSELNTVVIKAEIHAENTDAQHIVHFEEAQDFSDAGSLITQAPQSQSIHATINALSSWVSAIQPRESWYLAGWIGDSPIDFLVNPGAVVSAISLQSYEKINGSERYTYAYEGHTHGIGSSQQVRHECPWDVLLGFVCTWTNNQHGRIGCGLELSRYSGHGYPRRRV